MPMRGLVGRDFSAFERRRLPRVLLPALIALFIGAFGLVALRTEILKLRYELAHQLEHESALGAQQRDLTVRIRQLRAPRQLAQRAAALGFERPGRVIDLPGRTRQPTARLARTDGATERQP
jgi:hypothetical protein